MTADVYADAFRKLLASECPSTIVRGIEAGDSPTALWNVLDGSGFADALVAESAGGAGLCLEDVFPMLLACGSAALPVPLAFTMYARAVLADHAQAAPSGPIALAVATPDPAGRLRCNDVPWGKVAEWVLVDQGSACLLLPAADGMRAESGTPDSLAANFEWPSAAAARVIDGGSDLRAAAAALLSAHIAGAMAELLARSVAYANERRQFGKSISRFQAIQQQLSVMAEQVFAAHIAAEAGCRSGKDSRNHVPEPLNAAAAKARCSDAVVAIATIAHAVHGAIGVTREFDLQLLTRRLHQWRLAYGGEAYWHRYLGAALLSQSLSIFDFVRSHVAASRGTA